MKLHSRRRAISRKPPDTVGEIGRTSLKPACHTFAHELLGREPPGFRSAGRIRQRYPTLFELSPSLGSSVTNCSIPSFSKLSQNQNLTISPLRWVLRHHQPQASDQPATRTPPSSRHSPPELVPDAPVVALCCPAGDGRLCRRCMEAGLAKRAQPVTRRAVAKRRSRRMPA